MRRFKMLRKVDETGVSGTGEVLFGVVLPTGRVVVEWRSPRPTLGIYSSISEFAEIHVDAHPDCNEVVWIDEKG